MAWCAGLALVGCGAHGASQAPGAHPAEVAPEGVAPGAEAAEASPESAAPGAEVAPEGAALSSEALAGLWVEFWAPQGDVVATERYLFGPEGRFAWRRKLRDSDKPEDRTALVVGRWQLAGPGLRLETQGGSRTLEVTACPPNDEARALDEGYRCLAIGGRMYWWRDAYSSGLWKRVVGE